MAKWREATFRPARSLAGKLVLGFLLIAALEALVLGAVSFYTLRRSVAINRQLEEISLSLEATQDLEAAVARTMLPPSEFLIHRTPGEEQRFKSLMNEVEMRLNSCANAACHGAARQPKDMAQRIVSYIQGIRERAAAIFAAGEARPGQDRLHLLHEINHQGEEVNRQLQRMSSALLFRVDGLQRKSREVSQQARNLILVSTLSVVALAILTAYVVSRRLLKPIRELLLGTRHVREGDLAYRVAIVEKDEIGELAESFNAMAEELQGHRERLEKMVQAKTGELKRAQESLLQSEKLASIGLLASGVAHELNNPLTSILMNINLLLEEVGEKPDLQKELKRVSEDAFRCKRIIDDLRDFSRRHELDIRPSNLNNVVSSTLGLIKHELQLNGIRLQQELSSDLPMIPCDPDRMRQVLMNVFVNAIQAMPRGGVLTLRTGLGENTAEIAAQDTGSGIPRGIRAKIFDPFFTTKEAGTGLGLSIVYRIMEEHGGRIEVESLTADEAGAGQMSGTVIRLSLPLKAAGDQISAAGQNRAGS